MKTSLKTTQFIEKRGTEILLKGIEIFENDSSALLNWLKKQIKKCWQERQSSLTKGHRDLLGMLLEELIYHYRRINQFVNDTDRLV